MIDAEHSKLIYKIAYVLDMVMTAFEHDQKIVFEGERAHLEFKYGHIPKDKLVIKIVDKCSNDKCLAKPIEYSHTIQRSGFLDHIAENGHLISPQSHSKKDNRFGKIGINEASTFPGFCPAHELLFSRFENNKCFSDEQDYRLQLYRTICREKVSSRMLSEKLKHSKKFYQKFRNQKLDELFEMGLAGFGLDLKSAGIKKRRTWLKDQAVLYYNSLLRDQRNYRRQIKKLERAILKDIDTESNKEFYFDVLDLDFEIPVALAGRGGMRFKFKSRERDIDVILNVIPSKGRTTIIMGALKAHQAKITWYLSHFLENPFSLITMVESWMLYGSDHWFIKPSAWNKLFYNTIEKLYDEIHWSKKNILARSEYLIFIEARIDLLRLYKQLGESHREIFESSERYLKELKIEIPDDLQ